MSIVEWVEPYYSDEFGETINVYCALSSFDAIKVAHIEASLNDYEYDSDEDALAGFLEEHNAKVVNEH